MESSTAETNCPEWEILSYWIINDIFEILILIFFSIHFPEDADRDKTAQIALKQKCSTLKVLFI